MTGCNPVLRRLSVVPLLVLTRLVELRYRALKMFTYLDGTPYNWIICHSDSRWMLSKAFLKIYIINYEGCLKYSALLYDVAKSEDLFGAVRSILQYTGIDSSVMPRELFQSLRFPFLGSVTMTPIGRNIFIMPNHVKQVCEALHNDLLAVLQRLSRYHQVLTPCCS